MLIPILNHNYLAGYEVNRHIDWTAQPVGKSIALANGAFSRGVSGSINAGVFSMIQGDVVGTPTFSITQSGDDVTIAQTIGDINFSADGGVIGFGSADLSGIGDFAAAKGTFVSGQLGSGVAPIICQNTNAYASPYTQYSQIWLDPAGAVIASIRNDGSFNMAGLSGIMKPVAIASSGGSAANLYCYSHFRFATANQCRFRDDTLGIYSQADSFLDIFADGAVRIGDSSVGAPTNFLAISPTGDLSFAGTARLRVSSVTDAGPMTATDGTVGDVVYNTSDSKAYVCVTTGTPATWAAMN